MITFIKLELINLELNIAAWLVYLGSKVKEHAAAAIRQMTA